MNVYVIVAIILFFYLSLAWFAGAFLQLHGASLWILRSGLALIGLMAAGVFLWFHRRVQRQQTATPAQSAAAADEISILLRQVEQKLRVSKQNSLGSLPVVFILGELNSAKTSTVIHSGLEPELLAGHVIQDGDVAPTSTINVWYARNTVFIEVAGKLLSDAHLWMRLLRQTRPKQISAALGKGEQSPRAALICVECDGLSSAQSSAQKLGSRLKEMAQSLGAAFPVYVLFTKLDRLPHFADFVGNFTMQESAQIFGATVTKAKTDGVFAEEESHRLSKAFDQLVYSVAEKRSEYLSRETVAEKLPGVYEFPRELRKIRTQAVQLLVEMTRPTQLSTNPFLRGFYFSGVRPVVVNEAVSVAVPAKASVAGSGATRMFNFADATAAPPQNAPQRTVQSRKVPEWTFLPHLFTEIILRDRTAFASSNRSTKVDKLRRILMATAAVIFLFIASALVMSFFNNRALEQEAKRTGAFLASGALSPSDLPSVDQLRQLERLRAVTSTLNEYRNGAPLSYRFGLYAGDRIYSDVRRIYFQSFRRLLLEPTQARIISKLKQLPDISASSDDFIEPYNSLKAYLITRSFPDKSTPEFLGPALLSRWLGGQSLDSERVKLARAQFDFYSDELRRGVPITGIEEAEAVKHARGYLTSGGFENIYRRVLFVVGGNRPPINFNRLYQGSATYVINSYEVPSAFTKDGFKAMQEVIRNPEKFFQGEDWVLGEAASSGLSAGLRQQLQVRYTSDYVNHWRKFIKATSVVRYPSFQDAANKLQNLSGNTSFLLQLFTLAGQHTSVELSEIANEFQPLQLVAGRPEQLVSAANQPYAQGLQQLQQGATLLASTPPADPVASTAGMTAIGTAKAAVNQVLAPARIDNEIQAPVKALLLAPIFSVEELMRNRVPGSGPLCEAFRSLASKYPFNPTATLEASPEELRSFFQPASGTLWAYYDANYKNLLLRQGSDFVVGNSPVHIPPGFLAFLHRSAIITDALFPPGSQAAAPHLAFTLHQPLNNSIDRLNLEIQGKTLSGPGGSSQQFVWPGEGLQGVRLSVSYSGGNQFVFPAWPGAWGVFRFFQDARRFTPNGTGYELEWPLEYNGRPVTRQDGTPIIVRYELEGAAAQLFQKTFFQGLHCSTIGTR